jgi:hypothetical protein
MTAAVKGRSPPALFATLAVFPRGDFMRTVGSVSDAAGTNATFTLVVLALVGVLAYRGVFYTTGRIYYEGCYEKSQLNEYEPKTPDPYKAALWATCEPIARAALDASSMRTARDDSADRDFKGCPNFFSEVPIGGIYILIVGRIAKTGGPGVEDYFLPANVMVLRALRATWPNCPPSSGRGN